ncbi:hypothetical protein BS50DRAFT_32622 [Corynespora cassiicola Philippines]|uniref:Uncharacterized protein n=1 Tax=Corynespora cassiicola Philippines TaxID=1448308 RepID=A0A2T2PBQ7_CORCC|nr:hypothetical protein BS50DRAFT_32622 [Corynespora cassiicola Philippines]
MADPGGAFWLAFRYALISKLTIVAFSCRYALFSIHLHCYLLEISAIFHGIDLPAAIRGRPLLSTLPSSMCASDPLGIYLI